MKKQKYIDWAMYELYNGETKFIETPRHATGILRRPTTAELKNYFAVAGVGAYDPRVHWCGIFQVYLLRKAGVACSWNRQIVDDSGGKDLEIVTGLDARKDLAIGDIVKIHRHEHHFMVAQPATKGFLHNIEGNAGGPESPLIAANWGANMFKNVVEDVYARYRIIG